jgi:hypothetical protein
VGAEHRRGGTGRCKAGAAQHVAGARQQLGASTWRWGQKKKGRDDSRPFHPVTSLPQLRGRAKESDGTPVILFSSQQEKLIGSACLSASVALSKNGDLRCK